MKNIYYLMDNLRLRSRRFHKILLKPTHLSNTNSKYIIREFGYSHNLCWYLYFLINSHNIINIFPFFPVHFTVNHLISSTTTNSRENTSLINSNKHKFWVMILLNQVSINYMPVIFKTSINFHSSFEFF